MNKVRLILSLAVAIAATVVALRYRALRQAEAEQVRLRQQVEAATELRAAIAQRKKTAPATSTNAAISNAEHLELLRLRNEIGQLRRDLAAESNQMTIQAAKLGVRPVQPITDPSVKGVVGGAFLQRRINVGKQLGTALRVYAKDHGDQLPTTLADAAKFGHAIPGADDFELVVTGDVSAIKFPGHTIALREKQPWRATNGKWGRVYGWADGYVEVAYSATDDFTEWERRRTQIDPVAAK